MPKQYVVPKTNVAPVGQPAPVTASPPQHTAPAPAPEPASNQPIWKARLAGQAPPPARAPVTVYSERNPDYDPNQPSTYLSTPEVIPAHALLAPRQHVVPKANPTPVAQPIPVYTAPVVQSAPAKAQVTSARNPDYNPNLSGPTLSKPEVLPVQALLLPKQYVVPKANSTHVAQAAPTYAAPAPVNAAPAPVYTAPAAVQQASGHSHFTTTNRHHSHHDLTQQAAPPAAPVYVAPASAAVPEGFPMSKRAAALLSKAAAQQSQPQYQAPTVVAAPAPAPAPAFAPEPASNQPIWKARLAGQAPPPARAPLTVHSERNPDYDPSLPSTYLSTPEVIPAHALLAPRQHVVPKANPTPVAQPIPVYTAPVATPVKSFVQAAPASTPGKFTPANRRPSSSAVVEPVVVQPTPQHQPTPIWQTRLAGQAPAPTPTRLTVKSERNPDYDPNLPSTYLSQPEVIPAHALLTPKQAVVPAKAAAPIAAPAAQSAPQSAPRFNRPAIVPLGRSVTTPLAAPAPVTIPVAPAQVRILAVSVFSCSVVAARKCGHFHSLNII
jgi:hypothetical protein